MKFGDVIEAIKNDKKVYRRLWREMNPDSTMVVFSQLVYGQPALYLLTTDKQKVMWSPSHDAIFADDWVIEGEEKTDKDKCCHNCKYYVCSEYMKCDPRYFVYNNILNHDGLCTNTDKFTNEDDFCSHFSKL